MRGNRLVLVGALAVFCGCGVEAPLAEVCRSLSDQSFPASPDGVGTQTINRAVDEPLDLSSVGDLQGLKPKVRLKSLTLTAAEGITDFAFVDAVDVNIEDAVGGSLPASSVTSYRRAAGAAPSSTLEMEGAETDLWPYVNGGRVRFNASFTGVPPTSSWKMNIKACMGVYASLM
jgi:hypothetical protein